MSAGVFLMQGEHERALTAQARASNHMILMMTDARAMSIDELKAFLSSSGAFTFKGSCREETYAWVERAMRSYHYLSRPPCGERIDQAIHAEDDRYLFFSADPSHHPVSEYQPCSWSPLQALSLPHVSTRAKTKAPPGQSDNAHERL